MGQGSGEIRIGTAGWTVPAACAAEFPPPGSHLERYARRMGAAEINSSFHRPHRRSTYERWAAATPDDFLFSVKTPRALTHEQALREPEAVIDRFAEEVAGLGPKLGALLVQTPPKLAFDEPVAAAFFAALQGRIPAPVVCEPRHASWFTPETDAWLADRGIARVAADPAKHPGAEAPGGWRGLAYFRLHGSPRVYYSAYGSAYAEALAAQLKALRSQGPVWCIFDNTAGSAALGDALTTQSALGDDRG